MEGERKEGQRERDVRKETRPSSVRIVSLSCPRGCTDSCLRLSTAGLHLSCQALGIPVVHGETLGVVWLEVAPPRSGSLPAGYIGKLVLLLNGKAREILAKH